MLVSTDRFTKSTIVIAKPAAVSGIVATKARLPSGEIATAATEGGGLLASPSCKLITLLCWVLMMVTVLSPLATTAWLPSGETASAKGCLCPVCTGSPSGMRVCGSTKNTLPDGAEVVIVPVRAYKRCWSAARATGGPSNPVPADGTFKLFSNVAVSMLDSVLPLPVVLPSGARKYSRLPSVLKSIVVMLVSETLLICDECRRSSKINVP